MLETLCENVYLCGYNVAQVREHNDDDGDGDGDEIPVKMP